MHMSLLKKAIALLLLQLCLPQLAVAAPKLPSNTIHISNHTQANALNSAAIQISDKNTVLQLHPCSLDRYSNNCAEWKAIEVAQDAGLYSAAGAAIAGLAFMISILSLWATKRSGQRQLRAYLSISDVTLQLQEPQIDFTIQNHGQTPAYARAFARIWIDGKEAGNAPNDPHAAGIIEPGAKSRNSPGLVNLDYVRDGKLSQRVQIRINLFYKDVVSGYLSNAHFRTADYIIEPSATHVIKSSKNCEPMHGLGISKPEISFCGRKFDRKFPVP